MKSALLSTQTRRMLALSAAYTLVLTPASLLPLMVTTMITARGMSPEKAGSVLTLELIAIGLVPILLGVLQPVRHSLRAWMLLGGALSLVGHAAAMRVQGGTAIAGVLGLAGVGAGILLYALNASIAMSSHAIREYSIVNSLGVLAPIPLVLLIPGLLQTYGAAGSYGCFVAYSFVLVALLPLMPDCHPPRGLGLIGMGNLRPLHFAALMVSVLLPIMGGIAMFAFQDQIGQGLGWTADQMGMVITISFLGSFIGTLLSAWADDRFGWFRPTVVAIVGLCIAVVISAETRDPRIFAIAAFVFEFFIFITITYLLSGCARTDPSGRVGATGAGVLYLGMAFGPYAGGYLVERHGVASLGIFMTICAVLSVGLGFVYRRQVDNPSLPATDPAATRSVA